MLISASKLTTFSICPKQFYYKYIQKIQPVSSNYFLVSGSILHKIYERREYYSNKPINDIIKDFAADILQVEDPFFLTLELVSAIPKILKYPVSYATRWVEKGFVLNGDFVPMLYNLSNETVFKLMRQFSEGWLGFFDEVIWGDELEIIDLKTGYTKKVAKYQVQQDLYLVALFEIFRKMHGYYPPRIKFTFKLLRYGDSVTTTVLPEQLDMLKQRLQGLKIVLDQAIQTNTFNPSPSHFCLYCGYVDRCIQENSLQNYEDYKHLLKALKVQESKLVPTMVQKEKLVFRWEKVSQFVHLLEQHPELKQFVRYKNDLYSELLNFEADIDVDGLYKYLVELGVSDEFLKTLRR